MAADRREGRSSRPAPPDALTLPATPLPYRDVSLPLLSLPRLSPPAGDTPRLLPWAVLPASAAFDTLTLVDAGDGDETGRRAPWTSGEHSDGAP